MSRKRRKKMPIMTCIFMIELDFYAKFSNNLTRSHAILMNTRPVQLALFDTNPIPPH